MWNACVLHNIRAQRSLEQFLEVVLGAFLEPWLSSVLWSASANQQELVDVCEIWPNCMPRSNPAFAGLWKIHFGAVAHFCILCLGSLSAFSPWPHAVEMRRMKNVGVFFRLYIFMTGYTQWRISHQRVIMSDVKVGLLWVQVIFFKLACGRRCLCGAAVAWRWYTVDGAGWGVLAVVIFSLAVYVFSMDCLALALSHVEPQDHGFTLEKPQTFRFALASGAF